jgi:hypothetical protein
LHADPSDLKQSHPNVQSQQQIQPNECALLQ